ncbi:MULTISPECIES: OmpA family protein [Methylotenera]|uniref:OmpA family protein n=1 Tax=Methylotenera TaxID=359407 RepID=UPI0003753A6E|nr:MULTISPECIES: OmpA family protein [Methylotenera]
MQTNNSAKNQASYNRWTWIVALILALILLWMLLTGRGPTSACCGVSTDTSAETTIPPVETSQTTTATSGFSFTATQSEVTSTGDISNITWLADSDKLKMLLSGEDLRAQGDDKKVLLSGIVDSEAIKQQKGTDAQAFFGSAVTIVNQFVVKTVDSPVATVAPPAAVKLYFDTGKTTLPNDANTSLAAIIEWLKAHPEAKAVLSGYHDPSGNKASNEKLAKNRAESVEDALEAAGIDDDRIDKRKPQSVDGGTDLAEARRVEVSIE